jgi:hypothetical protein
MEPIVDRRNKRINPIPWNQVKEDWYNHEKPADIVDRYRMSLRTLYDRARLEDWQRKDLEELSRDDIIKDVLIKDRFNKRTLAEINKIANEVDAVRTSHRVLTRANFESIQDLVLEVKFDTDLDINDRVDALKKLSEASKTVINIEREIYGLTPQTETSETDILMQMTDDPIKAAEAYTKLMGM